MIIVGALLIVLCAGSVARGEQCGLPADVVFVIDSSSSIWIYDFEKQIKFVNKLVDGFEIAPDKTQVAALTFSNRVVREFSFNASMTKDDVKIKVNEIAHAKGRATFTHAGLEEMRKLFLPAAGHRAGVAKIGILLTDGESTNEIATLEQASLARNEGVTIIAIGVGKNVKISELKQIVSPPESEHMFTKNNFDDLNSNSFNELISLKACEAAKTTPAPTTTTTEIITTTTTTTTTTTQAPTVTTPEEINEEGSKVCQNKEADVVFILDMSSSIWIEHFKDQLQFVSDIIDKFDVDSGKTRVGAIAFSDTADPQFYLNALKTKAEVQNAVMSIKSLGGITNTHLALELLQKMFTKEHGSRPGVAHIAILITDGRSSMPSLTLPAVEDVHDNGIYVFAIGVGNMTDRTELEQMASSPKKEFMFEVNGYNSLPFIKNILAYKTCEVPQNDQPNCAKDIQSKILFGLYGIGGRERASVTEFIKDFGGAFFQAGADVEIGVTESCKKTNLDLTKYASAEAYVEAVQNEVSSTARNFASFLKSMYTTLPSSGDIVTSDKKQNTAILIVSGDADVNNDALILANRFKFIARIMVISIGGDSKSQLGQIASFRNTGQQDKTHFFNVSDVSQLPYLLKQVITRMCSDQ